jgi:hypothetical protein
MKNIKLPSHVDIGGLKYKVILDPTSSDGEGAIKEQTITVGTKNPARVPEIFLHEVLELILTERGLHYSRYMDGNDGIRIVMDHHDFENAMKDLALALRPLF